MRQQLAADREGDDLDGRHHLPGLDQLVGRQGRHRHRLVGPVEPVEPAGVDDGEAPRLREQVDAAGERPTQAQVLPARRPGHRGGGLVLAHVARLEPGHDDALQARRLDRPRILGGQHPALLEHPAFLAAGAGQGQAVRQDPALRLGQGHLAELHAAALF